MTWLDLVIALAYVLGLVLLAIGAVLVYWWLTSTRTLPIRDGSNGDDTWDHD